MRGACNPCMLQFITSTLDRRSCPAAFIAFASPPYRPLLSTANLKNWPLWMNFSPSCFNKKKKRKKPHINVWSSLGTAKKKHRKKIWKKIHWPQQQCRTYSAALTFRWLWKKQQNSNIQTSPPLHPHHPHIKQTVQFADSQTIIVTRHTATHLLQCHQHRWTLLFSSRLAVTLRAQGCEQLGALGLQRVQSKEERQTEQEKKREREWERSECERRGERRKGEKERREGGGQEIEKMVEGMA